MSPEEQKRSEIGARRLDRIINLLGALFGWGIFILGLYLFSLPTVKSTYHFTGYDSDGVKGCYSYEIDHNNDDYDFSNYRVIDANGKHNYKWMEVVYSKRSEDIEHKEILNIADFKLVDSCDNHPDLPTRDSRDSIVKDLSAIIK